MAVFSISAGAKGFEASVDGVNYGSEVDAAPLRNPVGKIMTGLTSKFDDAVNDVRANAGDITSAAKIAAVKPQGFNA